MNKSFTQKGGLWVVGQSVLMLLVFIGGITDQRRFDPFPYQFTLALLLFAAAASIGIAGVIALGASRTPYPEPRENALLVQHGIYGLIRHPLYTSVILWALSWALFWRSWLTLGGAVALAVFFSAKSLEEERQLTKRFPAYRANQSSVRKFIPWLY